MVILGETSNYDEKLPKYEFLTRIFLDDDGNLGWKQYLPIFEPLMIVDENPYIW